MSDAQQGSARGGKGPGGHGAANIQPLSPAAAAGLVAGAAGACLLVAPAVAAEQPSHGPSEAVFVLQLMTLLLVGRLLGEALLRLRQPAVMGQLMAGLVLGPSLLGALFPDLQHALFPAAKEQKAMLDAIAQFGVLLILLMTGMETDLKLVRASSRAVDLGIGRRHRRAIRLRFCARRISARLDAARPRASG